MKRMILVPFALLLAFSLYSCKKDKKEDTDAVTAPRTDVPAELRGGWLWVDGGAIATFDPVTGVYQGPEIGMAQKYTLNADGSGTVLSYIGSALVGQFYTYATGTYEVDVTNKTITFNATGGTFEKNGVKSPLAPEKLYPNTAGIDKFYYKVVNDALANKIYLYKKTDPNAEDEDYMKSTRFTKL